MHIVEVIPITRGIGKETLSYFTAITVTPGTVVTIPLRKKDVSGIVVSVKSVSEVKTELKRADYTTRKITSKKAYPLFLPEFISAAHLTARATASSTGAVLSSMIPKGILDEKALLSHAPHKEEEEQSSPAAATPERVILQEEERERRSRYRSIVREEFARHSSVFLCVSTIAEAEAFASYLAKGIEPYTFLFHSSLSKKEITKTWNEALAALHPVLIIGTPHFICLPRRDVKTIILEREHSRSYKQPARPYIDTRIFIEHFAGKRRIRLVLADLPLRIETLWRYHQQELQDIIPPKMRLTGSVQEKVIDMREEISSNTTKGVKKNKFTVISDSLKETLEKALRAGESVFLFAARRGHSPLTVCNDCGSVVRSEDESTPMALHKAPGGNVFVSHYTGETRTAAERCRVCKSWKLEALGIGVRRVVEEVAMLFPKEKIFLIDRDSTKTYRQARAEAAKFYASPGGILVGTEMSLLYLNDPIAHSAVVSVDSLLSLPHWRITEHVFSLLLSIREKTIRSYTIQTRKIDQPILEYASTGNLIEFYKSEIKARKALFYPPFSILIKITCVGTPARVTAEMKKVEELFKSYEIALYPSALSTLGGHYAMHGLLRIERNKWPDEDLLLKLHALPPHFAVNIDPETLL